MSSYHLHNDGTKHTHDDQHVHNHEHAHHHHHDYQAIRKSSSKTLQLIMYGTIFFALVEAVGGWYSGSLALLSDAGHMVTDSASIFLALWMAKLSQKPADPCHSYGHGRADTLGALINSLFMFVLIIFIVYEAIVRFVEPHPVNGFNVIIIASLGLIINIVAAFLLSKNGQSLNTKAALIHVMGDLLGSVATIIAGVVIYFSGWNIVDPILSIIICLIMIPTTWKLTKQSIHILMEGVPEHIPYEKVGAALHHIEGIVSVHDLHIWTMNSHNTALSAHILIKDMREWDKILAECQTILSKQFEIEHVTLQPEIVHIGKEEAYEHCFIKN